MKTLNPTVKVQLQRTKCHALYGNTRTRFIQKALEINFKKLVSSAKKKKRGTQERRFPNGGLRCFAAAVVVYTGVAHTPQGSSRIPRGLPDTFFNAAAAADAAVAPIERNPFKITSVIACTTTTLPLLNETVIGLEQKYPYTEPEINQFDDHRLGYSFDEREKDGEMRTIALSYASAVRDLLHRMRYSAHTAAAVAAEAAALLELYLSESLFAPFYFCSFIPLRRGADRFGATVLSNVSKLRAHTLRKDERAVLSFIIHTLELSWAGDSRDHRELCFFVSLEERISRPHSCYIMLLRCCIDESSSSSSSVYSASDPRGVFCIIMREGVAATQASAPVYTICVLLDFEVARARSRAATVFLRDAAGMRCASCARKTRGSQGPRAMTRRLRLEFLHQACSFTLRYTYARAAH
ncbi:unnamed protein product, partial [Trichogramma brassicae]